MENLGKECKSCKKEIFSLVSSLAIANPSTDFWTKLSELLNLALNKFLSLVFKFGTVGAPANVILNPTLTKEFCCYYFHWCRCYCCAVLLRVVVIVLAWMFFCECCCWWLGKKWNVLSSVCDLLLLFILLLSLLLLMMMTVICGMFWAWSVSC